MRKWLRKLFDIRSGEVLRAWLMFFYLFLVIASLLIIKPVRNSLFLTSFGSHRLPYAYMLVAAAGGIIIRLYAPLAARFRLNRVIIGTFFIWIICLALFWLAFSTDFHATWLYYLFYVWSAIFGIVSASQFWLLANYTFNAREAKRLFGFLGTGGILGGIFGGYLTNKLAFTLGTANLLLICICFLIVCAVLLMLVWRHGAGDRYLNNSRKIKTQQLRSIRILHEFGRSPYLIYLAAIAGIGVIVSNLVDFQFNTVSLAAFPSPDRLTAFFGFWLSNLSLFSLLIQTFLTRQILQRLGVIPALFFLPLGLLIGGIILLVQPVLWAAIFSKVCDGSFKQSIHKSGLELLYIPIPLHLKNQAKAVIDVFIDSFATGLSGLLLLVFTRYWGISIPGISVIILAFIAIWMVIIGLERQKYVDAFRAALVKRSLYPEAQRVNLETPGIIRSLQQVLDKGDERGILYVLTLLASTTDRRWLPYLKKLIHHPSSKVKLRVLTCIRNFADDDMVFEASQLIDASSSSVRLAAMRYLYHYSYDRPRTLNKFLTDPNPAVRNVGLMCAAQEYRDYPELREQLNMVAIFQQHVTSFQDSPQQAGRGDAMAAAASVVGVVQIPELYPFLHSVFASANPVALPMAIQSAGQIKNPEFLPALLNLLANRRYAVLTRMALAGYGSSAVNSLQQLVLDTETDMDIRIRAVWAMANIGLQGVVKWLAGQINDAPSQLRLAMIAALHHMKSEFPFLKFERGIIETQLLQIARDYYHCSLELIAISEFAETIESRRRLAALRLIKRTLTEKKQHSVTALLQLLGLRFGIEDMERVGRSLDSSEQTVWANALEYLDNLLAPKLKTWILPVFERRATAAFVSHCRGRLRLAVPAVDSIWRQILDETDIWLQICVIHYLGESRLPEWQAEIKEKSHVPDFILNETVTWALNEISGK